MARPLLALMALLLAGCATAPRPATAPCYHADEKIEKEVGYCQALRRGDTLYISGVAARGPMPEAIRAVYKRLQKVLEANGLTFADVVKENVYATSLDAFIKSQDLRKPFYGEHLPAATWVQVQRLYLKSFVLEVELVAEYP